MKVHELTATRRAKNKRVGRGIGSGRGKTATRGTKGQNSRTGGGVKLGFEGGQTKLSMRLPKARGFKAINPTSYQVVRTSALDSLKATTITEELLREKGIANSNTPIKLLFDAAVTGKFTVEVTAASATAIAAVQKAGGTVTVRVKSKKTQKPTPVATKSA